MQCWLTQRHTIGKRRAGPYYGLTMNHKPTIQDPGRSSVVLLGIVLMLLYLAVRLPGLIALPIFGDEAIYLRWAQLVREGHPWVCLIDPKPPLHFWLLAGVIDLWNDPLKGGRLLSVISGMLSVPTLMLLCIEIGQLWRSFAHNAGSPEHQPTGRSIGIFAVILMIFCPFLAFYQRMALAESLFILEMLAALWLSLRWARQVAEGESAGRKWTSAIALGATLGIAMMTRQGVSYTLWAMPISALVLHASRTGMQNLIKKSAPQFFVAFALALVIWCPYLLADLSARASEHGGTAAEIKRRILYQEHFTDAPDHWSIATRNAALTFLPSRIQPLEDHPAAPPPPYTGWFWWYLTPGIYIAGILGLFMLAVRRQWALLIFLLLWMALILGPIVALMAVIRSRYTLAGSLPLLISAAYLMVDLLGVLLALRWPTIVKWTVSLLAIAGLLAAPLRELARQSHDPIMQTLTAEDRYQYLTGWTAGLGSQRLSDFIRYMAPDGPLVVITDDGWGTPADALWVYLAHEKNVQLYYVSGIGEKPILRPTGSDGHTYLLRKDKWLYTPPVPVTIPDQVQVLFITGDNKSIDGCHVSAENFLRPLNPELSTGVPFEGVPSDIPDGRVMMLRLK